jgi:DNA-directed RNA polymerase specialized sigma24 family protein
LNAGAQCRAVNRTPLSRKFGEVVEAAVVALADDLAQQAFVHAWKSICSLRSPAALP